MNNSTQDPLPGVIFEVEVRIITHSNSAANYYYTKTVEMFAYEENENGELLLLLTQDSKESINRSSLKEYIDPITINPKNPESHPHVESFSKKTD